VILIPVKNLSRAKQRLSAVLDAQSRTELAHAMLIDVLQAISAFGGDDVSLVTSDSFALQIAKQYGFAVMRDDENVSETDAIAMATAVCVQRGIGSTLVVPGDIPLIEAEDLRAIYATAPQPGSVLVPSSDKRGSNAVLRRPAALFPLRFGNDSFMPHLSAAIKTDTSCVVLSLPRIALDVDTREDLQHLAEAPGEKVSQRLGRKLVTSRFVRSETEKAVQAARP
jgi:2-phospho-L-lactate/phosphoenolpyruvate guanylyltransferase